MLGRLNVAQSIVTSNTKVEVKRFEWWRKIDSLF